MKTFAFHNGRILIEGAVQNEASFAVLDGRMTAPRSGGDVIDLDGGWLVPGFVDVQVNGGGGVLFNDDPSVETIERIGAAHAQFGTTAFLPTLISDRLSVIRAALDAVDAGIERGVPGLIGIHIEGPFLNPLRNGIHDAAHFRRLDAEAVALLSRPRRGVRMLTLAPERNDLAAMRALLAAGVTLSIGHSDATYAQTRVAFEAGVTGVTHLYNAMSPLHHREPGVVGAALEDQSIYCGLIADNVHLHPAAIRIALAAKPHDRIMLVTDAMPSVGAVQKSFVLNGQPITVRDGVCVDATGTLAGCDLDMASAVRNMHAVGVGMVEALSMASANPAAFLGLSDRIGTLAPGAQADFVWLDRDLQVHGTWIGGVRVNCA